MPQTDLEEIIPELAVPTVEEPQYPAITLRIKNHTPSIVYEREEGESKVIASADHGMDTALMQLMEVVELKRELGEIMPELLTADELFISFPPIDTSLDDPETPLLKLIPVINHAKEASEKLRPQTFDNPELNAELLRNWGLDTVASALEEIYNVLIAQTVLMADELAVPRIQLHDERLEPRLREKMSKELGAAGVELFVIGANK